MKKKDMRKIKELKEFIASMSRDVFFDGKTFTTIVSRNLRTDLMYDESGKVVSKQLKLSRGSKLASWCKVQRMVYDDAGRLVEVKEAAYPENTMVGRKLQYKTIKTFTYDRYGRCICMEDFANNIKVSTKYAKKYYYVDTFINGIKVSSEKRIIKGNLLVEYIEYSGNTISKYSEYRRTEDDTVLVTKTYNQPGTKDHLIEVVVTRNSDNQMLLYKRYNSNSPRNLHSIEMILNEKDQIIGYKETGVDPVYYKIDAYGRIRQYTDSDGFTYVHQYAKDGNVDITTINKLQGEEQIATEVIREINGLKIFTFFDHLCQDKYGNYTLIDIKRYNYSYHKEGFEEKLTFKSSNKEYSMNVYTDFLENPESPHDDGSEFNITTYDKSRNIISTEQLVVLDYKQFRDYFLNLAKELVDFDISEL